MKFSMIMSVVSLALLAGCGSSTAMHANAPCNQAQDVPPLPKKVCYNDNNEQHPCDNFDIVGGAFATGSRYIYDETINAWRWASSTEMQEKYSKAWNATKEAATKAWEAAKEKYNERK